MIPEFPDFKKIELSDKADIEAFTKHLPPYSDFNVGNLLSWNIYDGVRLSRLHDNLAVRFTDHITNDHCYSFCGSNAVNETAASLIQLSKKEGCMSKLKFVPEEIAKQLDTSMFRIEEDRNSFDYIYATENLKSYAGGGLYEKRRLVRSFRKSYPDAEVKILDLKDEPTRELLFSMYSKWVEMKISTGKEYERNEELVFRKILSIAECIDLRCVSVHSETELLAFFIYEVVDAQFTISHISKADFSIRESNAFLLNGFGEIAHQQGHRYLNFAEDLGLPNLRFAKERFKPVFFLKKYTVTEK